MAAANDLVSLFLALELVSIPTYVMLYLPRHDRVGSEATLKYFLLGVFSSAMVLYGMSWLYGVAGSTNFAAIREVLSNRAPHPEINEHAPDGRHQSGYLPFSVHCSRGAVGQSAPRPIPA